MMVPEEEEREVDELERMRGWARDADVASRKAEEAAMRRHAAASWLRRTVGVVCARDLPDEPSEEEFRLGLRNGIVLCNALNKIQPGAIPKVVQAQSDAAGPADGSALCAYQYFENLRNFLVVVEDLGLPTFEVSDLEKGGKGVRVVDCVLALKSLSESTKTGREASCKHGGLVRPFIGRKYFILNNTDAFMNKITKGHSAEPITNGFSDGQNITTDFSIESNEMTTSDSLSVLFRTVLKDKKPEEVPLIVESILSKVIQEYEHRNGNQTMMDEEEQKLLDMTKKVNHEIVNGDGAAKQFQLEALTKFDLQHKQIQELKGALSFVKYGMEQLRLQYSEEFTKLGKHLYSLSDAASSYHKVLEENRKLYNQIQDLKGNIRVYCRVRPFLPGQICLSTSIAGTEERTITIITPTKYGKDGHKSFGFNRVFGPASTQEEVFSDMQPLIRSVLDGFNVCIFAYGQTGSGKTFTMSGPKVLTEESLGVNYRALNDLFNIQAQRKGIIDYEISVQMIEIYNEQVRDLLQDGGNRRLEIRNTSQKGLAVPDASIVPVTSASDVVELMNQGQKNRAVGSTAINDRSSRSHSCLSVQVQGKDLTSGTLLRGCMHLVDLAGSERVDKSEVVGDRLKEAQYINKSLSALGDVIASLAQKNSHVPYRNSKLTQLLQDSLGGQAKTLMFVHISPELDAVGETISTLKFAERVASVELGAAKANKESSEVRELKEQIACLKAALAKKEGEPENFQSTQSSPDMYRIKRGNAIPAFPKNRQPMEEVGNLENNATPLQKKTSFDFSGVFSDNYSSNLAENCNGIQKMDRVAVHDEKSENGNSFLELEPDAAQLPTFFYQRYNHDKQRRRAEQVEIDDLDSIDANTSCSSDQEMLLSSSGLKAGGNDSRGVFPIKKPQAKSTKVTATRNPNHAMKSPMSERKLQTPIRNGKQVAFSTIGGRRTPNGKISTPK
ncbi:kinesin-like protein KIN-14Q isoform X2 [Oryza brachyantha]|uniref:kinesin-like protein KIN-14Q isoform X2 n=1 Tax=Oryza brachyantha TaxID=4533 RepID=UPI001ADC86D4|nr:kinesin-like protein KIN-14Q isoform X2 [Oryza brachyantha]